MSNPASINQAFHQYPGGVSMIPPSPARIDLAFCDEKLTSQMRKLWEDHILWTRCYIIEAVYNTNKGAIDAAATRLLKNQTDIGNAMKPYFGNKMGSDLTALLKTHIIGAVNIIDAAVKGQRQKKAIAIDRWRDNGRTIARFMYQYNSRYWPQRQIEEGMRRHLDLTIVEIDARVNRDWSGDIRAYDNVKKQILEMSDMFSSGINRLLHDRQRGVA